MSGAGSELSRGERDLAALTVLALLSTGPRHPYDIHRFIVETRKDFVRGVPRSVYHAVDRLQRAHLIEPVASEQEAGRPERTVFALTDAGRAEARRRIAAMLSDPAADRAETVAALSYLGVLGRDTALASLRARIAALDAILEVASADLAAASGVPPILLVEAEFEQAQRRSERDWFADLVDRLSSGRLEWVRTDSWS